MKFNAFRWFLLFQIFFCGLTTFSLAQKIQDTEFRGNKMKETINPCMTPDPGFGVYSGWSKNISMGQFLAPMKGGLTKDGGFDVIFHFHGHEPIRKEFVKSAKGAVLVGIDIGIGSGAYSKAFSSPETFVSLTTSLEQAMKQHTGNKKAHIRKMALSSWSAGYGATAQILKQPSGKKVDAVILLDSLHAGYENGKEVDHVVEPSSLEAFISFAKKAANGKKFMFLSHSSIIPPGYASTTEVAHYFEKQFKGKPSKTNRVDALGLEMFERFDRGNFHIRGYKGDDKPDHCAHLGLMKGIVSVHLQPRWKTPNGKKK